MNKKYLLQELTVSDLSKIALVTTLYVVITFAFSAISFGPIQFRLAEIFNFLPLFNKRYVPSVVLGVAIANFVSPLGIIDVIVGSLSTFLVLLIVLLVTQQMTSLKNKIIVTSLIFALSMFTVAGMLAVFYHMPFWITYGFVALGEALSMGLTGCLIYGVSQRIDLTQ
ncbi:QueT transporter family protein [Vagococcus hydrophili]|uniref:QueT transporter family protein n=1 Tax=Vagococcus hydrophili TaxID=2714947 RepID=A0A6G8AT39_9ENTE|nr:QueT transporter family protein [Vagococcus hydrophili]QIL48166.1 QueT transporter family protein [Vagococcus hydrophili]